ncbi:MAG: tRNA dihydrouridine synthase DusB [Oscillospiraceae bacterium]|jgi:nifR3 family TIM-barrel protein|nr:tRNA dihydrouridine synthase DusB [Oscillospiraceae bacterium]
MQISGTFAIDPVCAGLAPMAGAADRALRELCVSFGAGHTCSEMVSAKGVALGDRKSDGLLRLSAEERPAGIQLFGSEAAAFVQALPQVLAHRPAFLDVNMGCPAPKIAGHGGGAALMKQPALCGKIIRALVRALEELGEAVPVSAKLRTGWDEQSRNAAEIAKRLEAEGAAFLTVHGRTRRQMYAPPVDYETIRAVKAAVAIPVIGNGDITDGPSAKRMFELTGCDGVTLGRGALGRPWVFRQIAAFLRGGALLPEPPIEERMRVMLEHIRRLCAYKGDGIGMREARKHAAWYMKGIPGAARLRRSVCALSSMEELVAIAQQLCEGWGNAGH